MNDWRTIIDAAKKLYVAGPWQEERPRMWVRPVIWRPRLDGPDSVCPCIDLDGFVAFVGVGSVTDRWKGSGQEFDKLEDAKANEDRLLRESGWILAESRWDPADVSAASR
jgi:hypothetical protein